MNTNTKKAMSDKPRPISSPFRPVEIPDDNDVIRLVIQQIVTVLQGPQGRCRTRHRSLAVTKLEEAFLWLGEDSRMN